MVAGRSADLSGPAGVAAQRDGTVYIADSGNRRVRKINSVGLITTVAGTGAWGFSGDGGQATEAELSYPAAVAVDRVGRIYVAEENDGRIRAIDPSGVITTLADIQGAVNSIALDRSGNLFVGAWYQILKVAVRDGTLETVAGTGEPGLRGDGGHPKALASLLTDLW